MKRFILACLLALPFTALADNETVSRQAVLKGVNHPESARFSRDYAEIEYTLNGRPTLVSCGAVNAKNAAGKFVGEHMYFVSFFKDESLTVPVAVSITHPSELTNAMNQALDLPDDSPKKAIMEAYAKCVVKMLDQPPPEY